MTEIEILGDPPETVTGGSIEDWKWFDKAEITLESDDVSPDFIDLITGGVSIPADDVTSTVNVSVPAKREDGSEIDLTFTLYRVKFEPFRIKFTRRQKLQHWWWRKTRRARAAKKYIAIRIRE